MTFLCRDASKLPLWVRRSSLRLGVSTARFEIGASSVTCIRQARINHARVLVWLPPTEAEDDGRRAEVAVHVTHLSPGCRKKPLRRLPSL